MSSRPASTSMSTGDSVRLQMERSIDELAELARSELEAGRFFAEVLRRALQPGGASRVVLWRMSLEGRWDPAGEMPPSTAFTAEIVSDRQVLLNDIAAGTQPVIIPGTAEATRASDSSQVFSPLRHAGVTVGILETIHPIAGGSSLPSTTFQFFAALSEIAADFLSQQELQQLRRAKSVWSQWDQYQLRLGKSLDLASTCAAVANDGRHVIGCDRIAVLIRRGRRFQVRAISGVEHPDPRAGGVQALELLAGQVAARKRTLWAPLSPGTADDFGQNDALDRYRRESGSLCLGAVPVVDPAVPAGESCVAVIVFENFTANDQWADLQGRAESLVQRSSFVLRASIERSEVPWLGAWLSLQQSRRLFRRPGVIAAAVALAVTAVALIVIPAEFTVTGTGELWPNQRRDVFASTTGIVDQILVKHGDDVQPDQPLIVLRDPELEQDSPRISGDIATTTERLRGVQIARLTGGTTPDAAVRARQLTAEEEELKERLKTLERQRLLVEDRRQRLTLRSPIKGRVLTWDITQHLSARPVERGQSLLTIGETAGSWILEVHVADKDAGHMLRAQQSLGTGLEVDFQIAADPGEVHRGKIREVSLASLSDDRSSGHLRVVVEFDSQQIDQLRPGATAIPRIRCGRQSLGYVWLHDLIDAIRIRLLF